MAAWGPLETTRTLRSLYEAAPAPARPQLGDSRIPLRRDELSESTSESLAFSAATCKGMYVGKGVYERELRLQRRHLLRRAHVHRVYVHRVCV